MRKIKNRKVNYLPKVTQLLSINSAKGTNFQL